MKQINNLLILLCLSTSVAWAQKHVLVETESFKKKGGWVIDQQSFDVMESSYLLAHGLGRPVNDANTTVAFSKQGTYHIWVRTKDWAPFPKGPGKFQILIDGTPLNQVFGSSGQKGWKWYYGGTKNIIREKVLLTLADLTGFDGRCDAILFTDAKDFVPPNDLPELGSWRRQLLGLTRAPQDAGHFDLVVAGGGMAGTCAAISASRLGLQVALIQNRPLLGGNNSSEVRVHLKGEWNKNYYSKLGRIVRELDNGDPGNGNPDGRAYGDLRKLAVVR
jgi:hypothetical protein